MVYLVEMNLRSALAFCLVLGDGFTKCAGIVRGVPAGENEFPYAVSITYEDQPHNAGMLLSSSFVLSPCHCVASFNSEYPRRANGTLDTQNIRVFAGTVYANLQPDENQQYRVPDLILHHPQCKRLSWVIVNDYALLRMSEPFYPSPYIQNVEILTSQKSYLRKIILKISGNGVCMVIGWGTTTVNYNGNYTLPSVVLMKTEIRLIKWDLCMYYLCKEPLRACDKILFEYGIICALPIGGSGHCSGDDGGALVCDAEVLGFASRIYTSDNKHLTCGELPGKPLIFVRIDTVYDFLKSQGMNQ